MYILMIMRRLIEVHKSKERMQHEKKTKQNKVMFVAYFRRTFPKEAADPFGSAQEGKL